MWPVRPSLRAVDSRLNTTCADEGGALYFEVHETYASEVAECLTERGFVEVQITEDFFSKPRIVSGRKAKS